jgi:hypothetical protein
MTCMPATGSHPEPSLGLSSGKGKGKGEVHPRTGHEGLGGGLEIWLSSFFNLSARWWRVVNALPWPLGKRPGTHLQETGWAPGLVWKGVENLALT